MANGPVVEKEPSSRGAADLVCWIDPNQISPDKPTGNAPPCRRQVAHGVASLARLTIKTMRTLFFSRLHVRLLQGVERSSGQAIRIAYVGDNTSYHYLVHLFLSAPPEITSSRRRSWPHLSAELRTLSRAADLSVLDLDFPLPLLIRHRECLNVPRWVKQLVPIGDTWNEVLVRIGRKTRREAQRIIKKYGFRSRVVDGRHAAEHFYDRLYLPYIRQRHGQTAELVGRERFIRECHRSQVIQLLQGDNVVAAVAVRLSNRQMTLAWTGIDTELTPAQRLGAADALDFFSLIYAYQRGCSHMDMGHSRACLDDGVLRYKRKWGASVCPKKLPQGSFLIAPLTSSPAVFSLLANTRFITLDGGRLICRAILPINLREEELEGFLKHTWIDGLQRVRVLTHAAMSDEAARRFSWAEFVTFDPADRPLERFMASVPVPRN